MKKVFLLAIVLFATNLWAQASVQEVTNKVWNLRARADSLKATTTLDTLVLARPSWNFSMTARGDTVKYKLSSTSARWTKYQYLLKGETVTFTGIRVDTLIYKGTATVALLVRWGEQR